MLEYVTHIIDRMGHLLCNEGRHVEHAINWDRINDISILVVFLLHHPVEPALTELVQLSDLHLPILHLHANTLAGWTTLTKSFPPEGKPAPPWNCRRAPFAPAVSGCPLRAARLELLASEYGVRETLKASLLWRLSIIWQDAFCY